MTNLRLGFLLKIASVTGAILGGLTAVLVDGRLLQLAFAAVLAYVAWQIGRRGGDRPVRRTGVLEGSFYDPAQHRDISYGVRRPRLGFALSIGAGGVGGLLGVGGGVFNVPIMNLLMRVPLKATIATSNLMIGVTAATSAGIFYGRGFVDPVYAVPAALGILVGARVGPRMAAQLPARFLGTGFRVVLVMFAVLMIVEVTGVGL